MPVQKSVGDRWQKTTGCLMVVGYGLSETAPAASIDPVDGKTFSDTIGLLYLPLKCLFKMIKENFIS